MSKSVLDYMKEQNRPFSLNDLSQKLPDINKTIIQKALNEGVQDGLVLHKTYGKQTFYCIAQDTIDTTAGDSSREIDREISSLNAQQKDVVNTLRSYQAELQQFKDTETLEDLKEKYEACVKDVSLKNEQLVEFSEMDFFISDENVSKVEADYDRYMKEYPKRKRICMEMVDAILENYPNTKKKLLEELSVETDEDVGFKLNKLC